MPTREEDIDIMAFMLCPSDVMCPGCSRETVCTYRNCAQKLYDAGYRNIDGENYVSREWADELLRNADCSRVWDNGYDDGYEDGLTEFAERIKRKMPKLDEGEPGEYFLESDIDKLLKEYFEDGEQPN